MSEKDILLTPKEASAYLQIKISTLAVWRCNKTYCLPYIKYGGKIRYFKTGLDNWLKSRTVNLENKYGKH